MRPLALRVALCVAALAAADASVAQSEADRVLNRVRHQIVALRVFGDKAPTAVFPENEPPIWGTGFVIGPLGTNITDRQRIITAGHVVQKDDMWARRGGGPARTVYPWVLGHVGRTQAEGYRGVILHTTHDIAQVYGPRDIAPILIQSTPFSQAGRYFVASWGFDDTWGEPTEEPYVKEVKVVRPAANDPSLADGLALVEIVAPSNSSFKPSESGSPVLDINGMAVGIMIRAWVDRTTGRATRGVALPFASVAGWMNGVRQDPVKEPKLVTIAAIADPGTRKDYLSSVTGGCVFLGKYSARNLEADGQRALLDAPAGVTFLKQVIRMFPEAAPDRISDKDAILETRFTEPQLLTIAPRSAVNIRSHCPNVVAKPKRKEEWERIAYYGTVLARADSRFRIRVRQVQRQAYLKDFFYWGVVENAAEGSP